MQKPMMRIKRKQLEKQKKSEVSQKSDKTKQENEEKIFSDILMPDYEAENTITLDQVQELNVSLEENPTRSPKKKKKPVKFNKFFLFVIAFLSCTVSTWLTVDFVFQLRGQEDVVALTLGVLWEISKYTFGSLALIHHKWTTKFILSIMTVVLIGGSVMASMGYLGEFDQSMKTAAMKSDISYQDMSTEREIIKKQLEMLQLSAIEDTKRSFRRRGLETNQQVEELKSKYDDLGKKITELKQKSYEPKKKENIFYVILSVMLELCGIISISLITDKRED